MTLFNVILSHSRHFCSFAAKVDVLGDILHPAPEPEVSPEDPKDSEEAPKQTPPEENEVLRLPEYLNRFKVCSFLPLLVFFPS